MEFVYEKGKGLKIMSIKHIYLVILFLFYSCGIKDREASDNINLDTLEVENYRSSEMSEDIRYVILKDGLKLREGASFNSSTKKIIPFAASLKIIKTNNQVFWHLNGLTGKWVFTEFGAAKGYVFSAGLSVYPIPEKLNRDSYNDGDMKWYVNKLRSLEFDVNCINEKCSKVFFGGKDVQEVFLISKILFPELMNEITIPVKPYDHSDEPGESEANLTIDTPKGREKWGLGGVSVYMDAGFTSNMEIEGWRIYFKGYDGEATLVLKLVEGGAYLGYGSTP